MQKTKELINPNKLSHNLTLLLKLHDISESDLAKQLSIPYNTVHRILTGETADPRMSTIHLIADFFKISIDELLHGSSIKASSNEKSFLNVPLYNWESINDIFLSKSFSGHSMARESIQLMEINGISHPDNLLALKSTKSMSPRFPNGTVFIIDKQIKPIDGDLILVHFTHNDSFSLRELTIDSPSWILNPIVHGSETINLDFNEHNIVGVVILTLIDTRNA